MHVGVITVVSHCLKGAVLPAAVFCGSKRNVIYFECVDKLMSKFRSPLSNEHRLSPHSSFQLISELKLTIVILKNSRRNEAFHRNEKHIQLKTTTYNLFTFLAM